MKTVFTTRLKQSINERGLTQRMLATKIGTTEQSVSRWASGNRTPNVDALYKMCKALDVSADYLLGLSDEKYNNISDVKAELLNKIRKLWEENDARQGKVGTVESAEEDCSAEGRNQSATSTVGAAQGIHPKP